MPEVCQNAGWRLHQQCRARNSGITGAELQDVDREEGFPVVSESATFEEGLSWASDQSLGNP
jgi:hypothetical protein